MVTSRSGRSMLGCLFTVLLVVTVVYFGVNLGEPYWRYYQFRDTMSQMARFGGQLTDAEIVSRLRLKVDSLGLPPEANQLRVTRTQRSITIAVEYAEVVDLPLYTRHIIFRPRVESPL
jgi:hypothetical protein